MRYVHCSGSLYFSRTHTSAKLHLVEEREVQIMVTNEIGKARFTAPRRS